MGAMEAIISGVMSIFVYALVVTAVWKLFQIATELGEIKALLKENVRPPAAAASVHAASVRSAPAQAPAPPPIEVGPISLESAEALLREVEAESHALDAERSKTSA